MKSDDEDGFNPISVWEENTVHEGFTLWQLEQPVRKAVGDDQMIEVSHKQFKDEFQCPICMSILRDTRVVMSCLHRFCHSCIESCLRLNNNECPQCRAHIPSRRSLRADKEFDQLIELILGNVDQADEEEMKSVHRFNKERHENNSYYKAAMKGLETQMQHRKRQPAEKEGGGEGGSSSRAKRQRRAPASSSSSSSASSSRGARTSQSASAARAETQKKAFLDDPNNIQFLFQRHPDETRIPKLDREYIRTSAKVTMYILRKYVADKLNMKDDIDSFEISLLTKEDGGKKVSVVLPDKTTLIDAVKRWGGGEGEILLRYRLTDLPN
jgi:E3 ubiquitin-protein ligase RNF1/2